MPARSPNPRMALSLREDRITAELTDHGGVGFDLTQHNPRLGVRMSILHRMRSLPGGWAEVNTAPPGGGNQGGDRMAPMNRPPLSLPDLLDASIAPFRRVPLLIWALLGSSMALTLTLGFWSAYRNPFVVALLAWWPGWSWRSRCAGNGRTGAGPAWAGSR